MTQLGEAIAIGVTSDFESDCPFDHRHPEPQPVDNALVGVGGTLADKMKGKESTVCYERYKPSPRAVKNPGDRYRRQRPIEVKHYQTEDGKPRFYYYPITCAAHHLIPAQASLRECKNLLKYMCSKNDGGDALKGQGSYNGIVWNDIGYDVNGSENGVFLPGNYAVGGNGTGEWEGAASALDDEDEVPSSGWSPSPPGDGFRILTGSIHEIKPRNKKWNYVRGATTLIGAQFHDAHPAYSRFVLSVLNKVATRLNDARRKSIGDQKCGKCKDRDEKIADLGVPPPYALSLRLNGVSDRMKGLLTGGHSKGHRRVFTSRWGLAWAIASGLRA